MYADQLSQGMRPQPAQLTFYVRQEGSEDDVLGQVSAELPSYGSLGPLFFAFGLISEEELRQGAGSVDGRSEWAMAGLGFAVLCCSVLCCSVLCFANAKSAPCDLQGRAQEQRMGGGSCSGEACCCSLLMLGVAATHMLWLPVTRPYTSSPSPAPFLLPYQPPSCPAADDRDLAAWLRETVDEAVRTADQHDSLKRMIRELRVSVQDRFRLAAVQVRAPSGRGGRGLRSQLIRAGAQSRAAGRDWSTTRAGPEHASGGEEGAAASLWAVAIVP